MVRRDTSSETPKVADTPSRSAVMTLLENATTKHVQETTIVHHHLYSFDQFLGFSGSSILNVTNFQSSICPVTFDLIGLMMFPVLVSVVNSSKLASGLTSRRGRSKGSVCPGLDPKVKVRRTVLSPSGLVVAIVETCQLVTTEGRGQISRWLWRQP